ncbi:MAG: hypothetical protein KDD78_12465 [Caldilineaceae bacterium]|nr:hypothetical protein [Caldilineaceae bacterium]
MSEEQKVENPAEDAEVNQGETVANDGKTITDELFEELGVLGNRFVDVVQSAWNSEERKKIETDLKHGLTEVAKGLEDGFRKVSESEQTKDILEKADDVAGNVGDKVRDNKVVNDLAEGLMVGLRALAGKMEEWSAELNEKRAAEADKSAAASTDSQDIPIDQG